ncbi:mannan endo-1,4-beta-mannosidase 1-like [Miscanthus floridulus]|uniref:mannan endo-1,4-beta-mannosidase 1-like n=1 Tax=Miscanthus floridulus TaxID=154761 RepID=UPI0034594B9A
MVIMRNLTNCVYKLDLFGRAPLCNFWLRHRKRGFTAVERLLCLCSCVRPCWRQQQAAEARGDAFVRVQGTRFVRNGKPFFVNGFNAYWLMNLGGNHAQRGKVTSALSQAAGAVPSLARTWAFNDGNRSSALLCSPVCYNERTFQGFDFELSEARKYGIKMILSLVNYYHEY